jgi:hypothetical protein
MALSFFCQRFRNDLCLEAFFDPHLLEAPIFSCRPFHACLELRIHAAEFRALLAERGVSDAVLAAQLRYRTAIFGWFEDGDDLAVGKAERRHVELHVS